VNKASSQIVITLSDITRLVSSSESKELDAIIVTAMLFIVQGITTLVRAPVYDVIVQVFGSKVNKASFVGVVALIH